MKGLSSLIIFCIFGGSLSLLVDEAIKLSLPIHPKDMMPSVIAAISDQLAVLNQTHIFNSPDRSKLSDSILNTFGSIHSTSTAGFTTADSFSCQQLPTQYNPYFFCSGVVDYAFFVPAGLSVSDLDKQARTAAGHYPSSLLSTSCLNNVKRSICALIFMPCVKNVIPGDSSTYMSVENGASLPYVRPCRSLCETMDSSCGGMLQAYNLNPYCPYLTDPYSGISYYDSVSSPQSTVLESSQSVSVCNYMSATAGKQVVASPAEPYIGKLCEGITSEYYVPAPSTVDPLLAPWLPPFAIQAITEQTLASIEKFVPFYFSPDCLLARRKLMCSTFFLAPYENKALAAYIGSIFLPSFPQQEVCQDYATQCADLIGFAPILAMNCSAKSGGLQLYPTSDQVIASVNLGSFVVPLTSPPNRVENVTASFQTECPYSTYPTVPGTEHLKGTFAISGTACSLACVSPVYTNNEYEWMFSQTLISVWISMAFTLLQVVNLAVLKPQKQNIFLVSFILSTFLFNILKIIQVYANESREANICESDTQAYSYIDSVENNVHYEDQVGFNLCMISSVVGLYLGFFYWWILFSLSAEIWCRVVWGMKKVDVARRYYMLGSGVVLFANALLNTFYDHPDTSSVGLFCSWSFADSDTRFYTNILTGVVVFTLSFLMSAHSIYVCVKTSLSIQDADRKPLMKIWKSYSMLILFLLLEVAVNPLTIFYFNLYLGYVTRDLWQNGGTNWVACLFQHFTSSSAGDEYLEVCGYYPSTRITPVQYIVPYVIQTYLNAAILFLITLNKEVKSFWWTLFVWTLSLLGLKGVLLKSGFLSKQAMDKLFDASRESNILVKKNFRRQRENSFSRLTTTAKSSMGKNYLETEEEAVSPGHLLSRVRDSVVLRMMALVGRGDRNRNRIAVLPLEQIAVEEGKIELNIDVALKAMERGELDQVIDSSLVRKPKPQDKEGVKDGDDDEEGTMSPRSSKDSPHPLPPQTSNASPEPYSPRGAMNSNNGEQSNDIALFTVATME